MSTILSSERLGKLYGSFWALKDCSFTLDEGRVTGLVGPNGAGKSTLLELAIGLLSPTEGTIEIFGASPTREPMKVLPRVGFVAQEHPLYRDFKVAEMLEFGRKTNPQWDDAWARERIDHVGLPLEKKASQLSGGQQAQLAMVLALAKKPDLLLLDEPVAGFDPLARREFLRILMETVAESGWLSCCPLILSGISKVSATPSCCSATAKSSYRIVLSEYSIAPTGHWTGGRTDAGVLLPHRHRSELDGKTGVYAGQAGRATHPERTMVCP